MPLQPAESEKDASLPCKGTRVRNGRLRAGADGSSLGSEEGSSQRSSESRMAKRCLRRIRRWRVPPRWSGREWLEEVGAEATVATLQAKRDFDPDRGVPWEAFLRLRIMHAALARYRREWSYEIRRVSGGSLDEYEDESLDIPPPEAFARQLDEAMDRLPRSDALLIEGLFWEGKTEAKLAEYLGITQQAVNKRKRAIFQRLRRGIESLEKNEGCRL